MDNELIYLIKGIDKPTNEHLGRIWKGERVDIEIIKITYPDKTGESEKTGVVVDGKDLGIFDSDPQLPIGTKAEANIEPVLGGTILANYQNIQIKIGVLKRYDYKEVNFQGEVVRIVIDFIKATGSSYSLQNSNFEDREKIPVARMGERTLGEIKKESIPVLKKLGAHRTGAVLDVTLTLKRG